MLTRESICPTDEAKTIKEFQQYLPDPETKHEMYLPDERLRVEDSLTIVPQAVRILEPNLWEFTQSKLRVRIGSSAPQIQTTKNLFPSWRKRTRWKVFHYLLQYKKQQNARVRHVRLIKYKRWKPALSQCPEEPAEYSCSIQLVAKLTAVK